MKVKEAVGLVAVWIYMYPLVLSTAQFPEYVPLVIEPSTKSFEVIPVTAKR